MVELVFICLLFGGPPEATGEQLQIDSVTVSFIDDVQLSCEEPGRLAAVDVRIGDNVDASQIIARQEDSAARLEVTRVEAQLNIARFALENELDLQLQLKAHEIARSELDRAEQSRQQYAQSVSQSEVDRLRFAMEETELKIEQAKFQQQLKRLDVVKQESELAIAENLLARRTLRSPISGVIVELNSQPGEWIQPGEPVVRIVRLDRVRVEGLLLGDPQRIRRGQSVRVTLPLEDGTESVHLGEVTFIDPEIDPITGHLRIQAEVDNFREVLRPGHRPSMSIDLTPSTVSTKRIDTDASSQRIDSPRHESKP